MDLQFVDFASSETLKMLQPQKDDGLVASSLDVNVNYLHALGVSLTTLTSWCFAPSTLVYQLATAKGSERQPCEPRSNVGFNFLWL